MKEIKYAEPCYFENRGRNGTMKAHGIAVDVARRNTSVDEVILEPINSRGRSDSAIIMVAKDSLPELIAELIAIDKS